MGAGRPSEYDFKLCEEICDYVADGMNIKAVLNSDSLYPNWSTFRRWKNEHEELRTLYVNSQQDKAIALEFELDEYRDKLLDKTIDPSTYNTLAQTLKWKMAKMYPKVFGDNKAIDHTTKGEAIQQMTPITQSELDSLEGDV